MAILLGPRSCVLAPGSGHTPPLQLPYDAGEGGRGSCLRGEWTGVCGGVVTVTMLIGKH